MGNMVNFLEKFNSFEWSFLSPRLGAIPRLTCKLGPQNRLTTFLQRVRPPPILNDFLRFNTKQSDGKASFLELWGMSDTLLLPLLPGPLWPNVVVPVRVLSMGQTELFNHLLDLKPFNCMQKIINIELNSKYHIATLEIIWLYASELIMLNRIIRVR